MFSTCRGVGCIFTEMFAGLATFPGMKDAYDQLDQIFRVSSNCVSSGCTGTEIENYLYEKKDPHTMILVCLFNFCGLLSNVYTPTNEVLKGYIVVVFFKQLIKWFV